jgi:hypothetical protein
VNNVDSKKIIPAILAILAILIVVAVIIFGWTLEIPVKSLEKDGSLQMYSISAYRVHPGEAFVFHGIAEKTGAKEVRIWEFMNNSFTITSTPVDSRGEYSFTLSENATRALSPGPHLLMLQYPGKDNGFTIDYDQATGEISRFHDGLKEILTRINQSHRYNFEEISDVLHATLASKVPENTLYTIILDISDAKLQLDTDNRLNVTCGDIITINGTSNFYPGSLVACVGNGSSPPAFLPGGRLSWCSDNIRRSVDVIAVRNGTYLFALTLDSKEFKPGNYTADIWSTEQDDLEVLANFSLVNSTKEEPA